MDADEKADWTRGSVLRVARDFDGASDITGVFIEASAEWLLMERVEGEVLLNGYVAVRRSDVDLVVDLSDGFYGRALAVFDQKPTDPGPVDLTDVCAVITSAQSLYPLVIIHAEYEYDGCWIGQVRSFAEDSVHLREISPQAVWHEEDTDFEFDEISLVEFGTRYDAALRAVGGPAPT